MAVGGWITTRKDFETTGREVTFVSIDTEVKGLTFCRLNTLQLLCLGMRPQDVAKEMMVTAKTVENNAYWARNVIAQRNMVGAANWLFSNGLHPLQCWSEEVLAQLSAKYSTGKVRIARRPAPRKQDLRIPLEEAAQALRGARACEKRLVSMLAECDPLGVYPCALRALVAIAGDRSERMAERIAEIEKELKKKRESAPESVDRDA